MDTEYSKHVSDAVRCVRNHGWLSRKREHVNESSTVLDKNVVVSVSRNATIHR
jgi:hypothetical protein